MNHTQTTKHTPTYRRFNSYGFLRLYRVNPDGTQTQIGSFAGSDAPHRADERQREDAAKLATAVLATPSPPNVPTETPLHDLTDAQLDALNTWYCDLHGLAEGHIIRSVIDGGHGWAATIDQFVERETALTGGADGEIYSRKKRHSHTQTTLRP